MEAEESLSPAQKAAISTADYQSELGDRGLQLHPDFHGQFLEKACLFAHQPKPLSLLQLGKFPEAGSRFVKDHGEYWWGNDRKHLEEKAKKNGAKYDNRADKAGLGKWMGLVYEKMSQKLGYGPPKGSKRSRDAVAKSASDAALHPEEGTGSKDSKRSRHDTDLAIEVEDKDKDTKGHEQEHPNDNEPTKSDAVINNSDHNDSSSESDSHEGGPVPAPESEPNPKSDTKGEARDTEQNGTERKLGEADGFKRDGKDTGAYLPVSSYGDTPYQFPEGDAGLGFGDHVSQPEFPNRDDEHDLDPLVSPNLQPQVGVPQSLPLDDGPKKFVSNPLLPLPPVVAMFLEVRYASTYPVPALTYETYSNLYPTVGFDPTWAEDFQAFVDYVLPVFRESRLLQPNQGQGIRGLNFTVNSIYPEGPRTVWVPLTVHDDWLDFLDKLRIYNHHWSVTEGNSKPPVISVQIILTEVD